MHSSVVLSCKPVVHELSSLVGWTLVGPLKLIELERQREFLKEGRLASRLDRLESDHLIIYVLSYRI